MRERKKCVAASLTGHQETEDEGSDMEARTCSIISVLKPANEVPSRAKLQPMEILYKQRLANGQAQSIAVTLALVQSESLAGCLAGRMLDVEGVSYDYGSDYVRGSS